MIAIKEGELKHFDPLNEVIEVEIIQDEREREQAKTIGYYAMFEYLNGFQKAMYWSYEKMQSHADQYSQAYSAEAHQRILRGEVPQKICGNTPLSGTRILMLWHTKRCCAS